MNEQSQYAPPALPAALQSYRKIEELLPAHWTKGTVEANGIQQHYYRTGGGKPPLVLLHGVLAADYFGCGLPKRLRRIMM